MLVAGLVFDDGSLEWADLCAFVLAAPPGTAMFHAVERGWGTNDYLAAQIVDALNILIWQRTPGATKNPPTGYPDPLKRPGDEDRERDKSGSVSAGLVAATVTTVSKFLAIREERARRWLEKHKRG